jgi:hypothetical protein
MSVKSLVLGLQSRILESGGRQGFRRSAIPHPTCDELSLYGPKFCRSWKSSFNILDLQRGTLELQFAIDMQLSERDQLSLDQKIDGTRNLKALLLLLLLLLRFHMC